tara:strand:+ start:47 stop:289 length:243 start_codon:yes stop_codon:yes gene_type:complete
MMFGASFSLFIIRRTKWQKLEDQFTISLATRKRLVREMVYTPASLILEARHFMKLPEQGPHHLEPVDARSLIEAKDDEFK